ncbi:p-hydroxybenzoic acid efflux pump subunit AaeB [Legionella moravica]|uniref:p-hydroxybenzoic acid efflux pump subunit AaeB n=1 Tax=Legionella moravica TaxID=39962 RepID=A0A378JW09_9GAMM|nr:FUSC family protein [Legionella moravica]KTD31700.1 p-hydroxybenzoic acid efflux pump subunit AaeB [Legionella moravica]STX62220.1 p-hydroxybenzoic acid efflux pump subunit AaeB [Legionella moravica]
MFFWPQSVENRAALRTAIAALVAILISFKFHLETPYWSGMTVVIVSNLYTGSIIDKATMRILGTIAGAFLGYFIAGLVVNSFLLYLVCCFLVIAVSVYFFNYSKHGYAYLLGALCIFIVISQLALNPQNAFFVAIWRPVEIGIGVFVAAVNAYAVFPNHIKDNMVVQVHDIFDEFLAEFKVLHQLLIHPDVNSSELAERNLKIKKKIRTAIELIGALNQEIGVKKEHVDRFRAYMDTLYAISRQFQYLIILQPQVTELNSLKKLDIDPLFTAIEHDLLEFQTKFDLRQTEVIVLQTSDVLADFEQRVNRKKNNLSVKSEFIYSFINYVKQLNQNFILIKSLSSPEPVAITPKYKVISKQQRLRSDYDLIKHCIKAGLSVLLALGFWFVSNWPGGLNGIISSLVISIKGKNLFDMKHVSIHRFMGCFLGGGVGLISLAVFEMNLYELIIILLFFVWAFSYFMFKMTEYSYIGLQANIALIITLAQQGGPPIGLDPPLQRLAGIIIGITATIIVANVVWRSDVWTILKRYIDKLYRFIAFNLEQVILVAEDQRSLHDLANLFWLSRGLITSLGNEQLSLKKQNLLSALTQRFESLVIVQATISHILVTIDLKKAHETALLFQFDLLSHEKKLIESFNLQNSTAGLNLSQTFGDFVTNIDHHAAFASANDESIRNLLAYVNALKLISLQIN